MHTVDKGKMFAVINRLINNWKEFSYSLNFYIIKDGISHPGALDMKKPLWGPARISNSYVGVQTEEAVWSLKLQKCDFLLSPLGYSVGFWLFGISFKFI